MLSLFVQQVQKTRQISVSGTAVAQHKVDVKYTANLTVWKHIYYLWRLKLTEFISVFHLVIEWTCPSVDEKMNQEDEDEGVEPSEAS